MWSRNNFSNGERISLQPYQLPPKLNPLIEQRLAFIFQSPLPYPISPSAARQRGFFVFIPVEAAECRGPQAKTAFKLLFNLLTVK